MKEQRLYPSRALHGQVAHLLGRRIVEGIVAPGQLLPREAELAAQFKVSRQAVREALKVLAAKGLVASRRRTGTHVLPRSEWNLLDPDVLAWHPPERLPRDFFRDLVELRTLIEPFAAESAARRGRPEDIAAIGKALEKMRTSPDDIRTYVAADLEFHAAIAAASGNMLVDRLSAMCEPLLNASFNLQPLTGDSLPLHTAIYDAIACNDPVAARRAMKKLVDNAMREVEAIARGQR